MTDAAKTINDTSSLFNDKSELYASSRPQYPKELFHFLASLSAEHHQAWDCATGNGQAALGLAQHFAKVQASDISQNQLGVAFKKDNIYYSQQSAEQTNFSDNQFDLVNVAQALHWFDLEKFWPEVQRVTKAKAIFVAYTYAWSTVNPQIDTLILQSINSVIEPYWAKNNQHCVEGYQNINFPFQRIKAPAFTLKNHWNLEELFNFLHSWSTTRRCMQECGDEFFNSAKLKVAKVWGDPEQKKLICTPLTVIAGRL